MTTSPDGGPRGPNKVKPHLHGRTPAPEKKLPSMGRHRLVFVEALLCGNAGEEVPINHIYLAPSI